MAEKLPPAYFFTAAKAGSATWLKAHFEEQAATDDRSHHQAAGFTCGPVTRVPKALYGNINFYTTIRELVQPSP
jgi:hypothetical protein